MALLSAPRSLALGLASFLAAAMVAVVVAAGPAEATGTPEAFVATDDGTVVAEIHERGDAPAALEAAFSSRLGTGLRIEYVYNAHIGVSYPVDDPLAPIQWHLDRVRVASAWASVSGGGAVVAIVDSPVNVTGSDGFCAPVVHPYDAITGVAGFAPLNVMAEFGHGTHIAGTVAQCTNNGIGVAGLAPGAAMMPVKVLDDTGFGMTSDLVEGIDWAVAHGADVINLSLGRDCDAPYGPSCSDVAVDAAIRRAHEAGIVLVASSGNQASSYLAYPAAHPDVIAVGATTRSDLLWVEGPGTGSNRGSTLDLVAPGVDIVQETTSFGVYGYGSGVGTSSAAPQVAAAAALMLELDPTLRPDDIRFILRDRAVDLGSPGYDTSFGAGLLDIAAATEAATPPCPEGASCDTVVGIDVGSEFGLRSALVAAPPVSSFFFGDPGDVPFMGDWDGDGVATPGLYRQSDGFVYVRDSNTQGVADREFFFGDPGDVPLVGDFDGDGRDSVSVWRASEARVYVINELGGDGGGLGAAEYSFGFGNPGDTPFVGDFDGDGVDSVGLYRTSTGFVYFRNGLSTGVADLEFFFGDPGDQILAGDWDGDGDDTVAVYRPSTGRLYVNLENAAGTADWTGHVGTPAWVVRTH